MAELVWQHKRPLSDLQASWRSHQIITSHYYPGPQSAPADVHSLWHNRIIHAERSAALQALLPEFRNMIDLIYVDPPFMTGRTFTAGSRLAYSDNWNNNLDSYLEWLYATLALLHTLLAPAGSLYVHLDWRTTHYAKLLLDEIFGASSHKEGAGFKNEIIWHYKSGGRSYRYYARKHDTILLYTRSARYCFHGERVAVSRGAQRRNHMRKQIDSEGKTSWTIRSAGRIYTYHENSSIQLSDVWHDISHLHQKNPERTGYATQKPATLLERIILASSEEQNLVLDCFCGSGVTPVVAERLKRRWIACDSSEIAITTTCERLLALPHQQPFALQYVAPRMEE